MALENICLHPVLPNARGLDADSESDFRATLLVVSLVQPALRVAVAPGGDV